MAKKGSKQALNQSNNANLLKFSRQSTQQTQQTVIKTINSNNQLMRQKYITTDTSLPHVVAMISMGVCRQITNNELIRKRLFTYLCLILIGGLINDFVPLISRSFMFKVHKTNVLNQWFVKIGWFWTTLLTFPLMTITSLVLKDEKKTQMDLNLNSKTNEKLEKYKYFLSLFRSRQLLRLLFNTLVWFISTNLFMYFEDITGSCLSTDSGFQYELKSVCIKNGYKWMPGFDISGHTFLLIYSNLILIEESAVMIGWEPFGRQLFERIQSTGNENHIQTDKQFRLYNQYSQTLRVLFLLITILSVIWDFMLIQTSLFYHTMLQKLVAGLWAAGVWSLTYRYLYPHIAIDVKAPKLKNS